MAKELLFKRTIDDLGRIGLPTRFRKDHGIKEGDNIAFYKANGQIIMGVGPSCVICKKTESAAHISGADICAVCLALIRDYVPQNV
ncbi:MAG: AbrB/MazE/SpoVT family DNA-binding domain-containing protein [Defluviitaleaceae bacterium]|nr:AbrB/MazE/SpoVT family DNA-binding domain-containing protein [Defluviitaleaceae bacterium]